MFEIFVDSRNYVKHGSAFAVVLKGLKHIWKRGMGCGGLTINQAELRGIIYSIQSIKPVFHGNNLKLFTKNKYISLILARNNDSWKKTIDQIESNRDLISQVRGLLENFKFEIILDTNCQEWIETKKIIEETLKNDKSVFIKESPNI